MILTNVELYKKKYDYKTLKENIYVVSLLDILKTQKLTSEFCVKYILNKDFQFSKEEEKINIQTIKKYQPHLLDIDIVNAHLNNNFKKNKSMEDFETFMNKNL